MSAVSSVQQVISLNSPTFTGQSLDFTDLTLREKHHKIWTSPLVVPAFFAVGSALFLALHAVVASRHFQKSWARITRSSPPPEAQDGPLYVGGTETNVASDFSQYVEVEHGGLDIFGFRLARFLSCLTLVVMSLVTAKLDGDNATTIGAFGKKSGRKHREMQEWIDFIIAMTNLYALALSVLNIISSRRWVKVSSRHLTVVLLSALAVYAYRDLYPLITFHGAPADVLDWKTWTKIAALTLGAVVIPLVMPTQYVPVDPLDPMPVPNPEQTASWISFLTFSFLNSLIITGNRISKISTDQLPPLADYSRSRHLKAYSFQHVDAFANPHKRHLFWGLMRVFYKEYAVLTLMVIIQTFVEFAAPLGIKNILSYLETDGRDATIRPWFWISWLFLGPFTASVAFQVYIFNATKLLAHAECILTQLIFEHSLRIRVKAETCGNTTGASVSTGPTTPDSTSIINARGESSEDETVHSAQATETTLQPEATHDGTGSKGAAPTPGAKVDSDESSDAKNLIGKINNLVTTDLNNIVDSRDFLWVLIYIPLQVSLCIVFLYKVLGWSSFVGMGAMVLLFPAPGYIAALIQGVQKTRLKKTDARVQVVSETMNVLRMVKLFGWENNMNARIAEKREEELVYVWKRQMLDLANGSLNYVIPVVTMIASYTTFVRTIVMKQELTASIVFSSMAVFDMLRMHLNIVFYYVSQSITGKVSLDRVNDFLTNTELLDAFVEPKESTPRLADQSNDIGFHQASFKWSSDGSDGSLTPSKRTFVLQIEEDLFFPRGKLSLILGPTGSGKTSLLMALLGEMHYMPIASDSWFNLPRGGGIAYAAQESWVQNETIKENIVFGAPFDEKRYNKVVEQCGLMRDLTMFEAGDQTEIGEKGLTLSGGQKARITLARAVYSSAEILLLDDVLAALDVHTAKWIVEKCFAGDLLKGRTVILVTHNVALASPIAQFAVSLSGDGRVVAQGTMSDVLKDNQELAQEFSMDEDMMNKSNDEIDEVAPAEKKAGGKLIVEEEVEEGHVSWSALKMFFKALGGKRPLFFFFLYLVGILITESTSALQTWFLGYWAQQYTIHPPSEVPVTFFLGGYTSLLFVGFVTYALSFIVFIYGSIRASRTLHKLLIESVLGTTLRWLDTTPISRVITRCTQDIRTVDGELAHGLWYLSEMTISMVIKFGAVILLTPVFLIPGVFIAVIGGWCGQIYIKAQLSVKREMSNAKAPVIGHFGAAISGLTSLRAYGVQQAFIDKSLNRIDRYTRAGRTFYNLNRWIAIRVDTLSSMFSAALAGYLVYFDNHTASNTGFSLNMAVGFSGMIIWWIRIFNDFEVQGNSLERIERYIEIEQEPKPVPSGVPPAHWPTDGTLHVEKLSARYSLDGPKILQDMSFDIKAGERVGIVGRTGSGKSSFTLSLLRCIFSEGRVVYSGTDTSTINLDALRRSITIIPQMPELLSGSLRENLDPFDQYDDHELNDALRSAGLFSLQDDLDEGLRITLDSAISSAGGNLSVGQRQIIALARAIIRGSKLLILDEATSAIDHKTDAVIQSSLRERLGKDVTVLTVAHRLHTIMDADRIMVLDAGRIVEFDKPSVLLNDPASKLRALVDESGDKDILEEMTRREASSN